MFRFRTSKKVPAPPKRVLLAWEYGAGRTHYANLLAIATHLRGAGIECLATLYNNTTADREFAAIGVRTIQNFVWPSQLRWHPTWQLTPSNGFTDFLANIGLGSSSALAAAIAHYDTLFSLFRPDLVLCDQAYGAVLAARDVFPTVVIGACTALPPVVNGDFPLHPDKAEPKVAVETLLTGINQGLALAGRFPLARIGDLFSAATLFAFGPREFDLYDSLRRDPVLPPNIPELLTALPQTPDGEEVFVYLHGFVHSHAAIIDAICELGLATRAFIPDLSADATAKLVAAGISLEERAVPLGDILNRSRLVVHHGGPQLACACLAAGVPQVILSKELDNRISGGFVEAHGLGKTHWLYDVDKAWIVSAVRDIYGDTALHTKATASTTQFRRWFSVDSSEVIASRIAEILGLASLEAQRRQQPTPAQYDEHQ